MPGRCRGKADHTNPQEDRNRRGETPSDDSPARVRFVDQASRSSVGRRRNVLRVLTCGQYACPALTCQVRITPSFRASCMEQRTQPAGDTLHLDVESRTETGSARPSALRRLSWELVRRTSIVTMSLLALPALTNPIPVTPASVHDA